MCLGVVDLTWWPVKEAWPRHPGEGPGQWTRRQPTSSQHPGSRRTSSSCSGWPIPRTKSWCVSLCDGVLGTLNCSAAHNPPLNGRCCAHQPQTGQSTSTDRARGPAESSLTTSSQSTSIIALSQRATALLCHVILSARYLDGELS